MSATTTETTYPCPECGFGWDDADDAERCCRVNEDCPEGCHGDHGAPEPDANGQWECPETGTVFDRCDLCDEWTEHRRYDEWPVYIDGYWVCDPYEHEYEPCCNCGEYVSRWDIQWADPEYCEEGYCERCWGQRLKELRPTWIPDNLPHAEPADTRRFREFDVVRAAADFYLAEWVVAQASRHSRAGDPEWRFLRLEAEGMQDAIVDEAAPLFAAYLDGAIGGELRHYPGMSHGPLSYDRADAAWRDWPRIRAAMGTDALRKALETFDGPGWGSGYGGDAWSQITRVLLEYEEGKRSDRQFVDNVFSMQHNGGVVLDKVAWAGNHCIFIQTAIGPAHQHNPTDLYWLMKFASETVRRVARHAVRKHNRERHVHADDAVVYGRWLPGRFQYGLPYNLLDDHIRQMTYDAEFGEGVPWPTVY